MNRSTNKFAICDALELRRLFAVTWDGGGDGINWFDGLNWSTNNVPNSNNVDVVINVPASNPVIRIAGGSPVCRTLTTSEDVFSQSQITINALLTLQSGATFRIGDAANPGNFQYWIRFNSESTSIDGTGTIELGSKSAGIFVNNFNVPAPTMTIASGITIKQTGGTNGYVRLSDLGSGTIINHGTIEAAAPSATLDVGGASNSSGDAAGFNNDGTLIVSSGGWMNVSGVWATTGPMNAVNGTFSLQGSYSRGSIAQLHRTGPGATTLDGSIDLTSGPLVINDATGSLTLNANGYLNGPGTVQTSGNAELIWAGGELRNITIDGRARVAGFARLSTALTLAKDAVLSRTSGDINTGSLGQLLTAGDGSRISNLSFFGTVIVPAHTTLYCDTAFSSGTIKLEGDGSQLVADGSQAWSTTIVIINPSAQGNAQLVLKEDAAHTPMTLSTTVQSVIRGGGGAIVDDPSNSAPATFNNNGIVHANVSGATFTIAPGIFTNQRTAQVSNGATMDITTIPTNYNAATHVLTGGAWVGAAGCTLKLPASVTIFDNAGSVSLSGAGSVFAAFDSITRNSGTIFLASGRSFTPAAALANDGIINVNAGGTLALAGANGIDGTGTIAVALGGVLSSAHVRQSSLGDGGLVAISPSGDPSHVSVLTTLAITGSGKLDLADNDLRTIVTPASTIRSYIASAYHFGDWLGTSGIFSSTARDNPTGNTTLGLLTGGEYLDNNGDPTFDGQTVQTGDALVKYTYFGDVDFNGSLDASDYNLIDFGFANHLTGWANGDADYSGAIDASDYNVIDFAFATQTGVL